MVSLSQMIEGRESGGGAAPFLVLIFESYFHTNISVGNIFGGVRQKGVGGWVAKFHGHVRQKFLKCKCTPSLTDAKILPLGIHHLSEVVKLHCPHLDDYRQ